MRHLEPWGVEYYYYLYLIYEPFFILITVCLCCTHMSYIIITSKRFNSNFINPLSRGCNSMSRKRSLTPRGILVLCTWYMFWPPPQFLRELQLYVKIYRNRPEIFIMNQVLVNYSSNRQVVWQHLTKCCTVWKRERNKPRVRNEQNLKMCTDHHRQGTES